MAALFTCRLRVQLAASILIAAAVAISACEPRRAQRTVETPVQREPDKAPAHVGVDAGIAPTTRAREEASAAEAQPSDGPKPVANEPEGKPCKGPADGKRDRFGRCITGKRYGHRGDF